MNAIRIQRILCPIDFSEFSVKAFDYAQSLARHYKAQLLVQHVVQRPLISTVYYSLDFPEFFYQFLRDLRTNAEKHLKKFLKDRTQNGFEIECVVQEGVPADSILSLAKAQSADLIVMGTHGLQGVDRLVLGSVAEKVLRKARCPVLTVRRPEHDFVRPEQEQEPIQIRKILFCTDFSDYAHRAFHYALSLTLEYKAELTLLHVLEETGNSGDRESAIKQMAAHFDALITPAARERCTIKTLVRIGKPYEEIIQLARQAQTDLIVMGVLGRSAADLLLFGSITHRVIRLGPCPVLAVRGYSWHL